MSELKKCAKCKEEKPFTDFPESTRSNDGYASVCVACKEAAAVDPPTTNDITPEEEARLIKELMGELGAVPSVAPAEPAKPKLLEQTTTGHLYIYTDILAERDDMRVYE